MFYNSSGWGAPGCPGAVYAYVYENEPGGKAMLSLAMASKATQVDVKFRVHVLILLIFISNICFNTNQYRQPPPAVVTQSNVEITCVSQVN
jgi:hypothetical protein